MNPKTKHLSRTANRTLWAIQIVLALLFAFAGTAKLIMPAAQLAQQTQLPVPFLRFIGVAEFAGALGLILPGALGIRRGLTALAAAGLFVIMIGAVVVGLLGPKPAAAIFPLVVGLLTAYIAWGRSPWAGNLPATVDSAGLRSSS